MDVLTVTCHVFYIKLLLYQLFPMSFKMALKLSSLTPSLIVTTDFTHAVSPHQDQLSHVSQLIIVYTDHSLYSRNIF
jgi:hypothetical protein